MTSWPPRMPPRPAEGSGPGRAVPRQRTTRPRPAIPHPGLPDASRQEHQNHRPERSQRQSPRARRSHAGPAKPDRAGRLGEPRPRPDRPVKPLRAVGEAEPSSPSEPPCADCEQEPPCHPSGPTTPVTRPPDSAKTSSTGRALGASGSRNCEDVRWGSRSGRGECQDLALRLPGLRDATHRRQAPEQGVARKGMSTTVCRTIRRFLITP
jgi:hypothetical protein